MVKSLILNFRTLTPVFMGGAGHAPALRAASFKGLLRFWYRAADSAFGQRQVGKDLSQEERYFGGTAEHAGQSPFLLRIDAPKTASVSWPSLNPRRFDDGRGRQTRNGFIYLGFPFGLRGGERLAIPAGKDFMVRCTVLTREMEDEPGFRRALLAAWWLLAHFGGAGSRSRRGFGSLALMNWEMQGGDAWSELDELPLLSKATGSDTWKTELQRGLGVLRAWFGEYADNGSNWHHPRLGRSFDWVLGNQGRPTLAWAEALNEMGLHLQAFRLRKQPDYDDIKAALGSRGTRGSPRYAPSRASFGLPLAFRFSSAPGTIMFAPYDDRQKTTLERQGSLLFLRLVLVGDRVHPLYVRLHGDIPGIDSPVAVRGQGRALAPAKENLLDAFMAKMRREA